MNIIEKNIKWIMIISGALTCSMIYAAIAPEAALMSTFGETISGPIAEIVVRNWGALITIIGAMLIFGAFKPIHRSFVLVVASIGKIIFIGLVLTIGSQYLNKAGFAIVFDSIVVIIYFIYLIKARRQSSI
jgi:hypothetical protein